MKYLYLFGTILFTVYGQIVLKWRMSLKGQPPAGVVDKIIFVFRTYTDLWIISGFLSAFIASAFWILAMTKFELSYAYPFMSASFLLVLILSFYLFNESLSTHKIIGIILIMLGIIISSKSI